MPPLASVPKVIKVEFIHTLQENTDILNRIFVAYAGTDTVADITALVTHFGTAWAAHVMANLSSSLVLEAVQAIDLSSPSAPAAAAPFSSAGGDTTGNTMSANVAVTVQKKLSRRYRGGHPRTYLAGASTQKLVDTERWSSAAINTWEADWTAWEVAAISGAPAGLGVLQFVNVSFFSGFINHTFPSGRTRPIPVPRVTPLVDIILSTSINPRPTSQRRRTFG
jgi:predicted transcriptional regulator